MTVGQYLPYMLLVLLFALLFAAAIIHVSRRRAENRLRDQYRFLQTLLDSIPSPIFYKDTDGVYQGCNEAFLTMLGRSKEELVGKTVYDISPQEMAEVYEKADNDLFQAGGVQRYETQVRFADGSTHEMFFTKAVFSNDRGETAGLLGVMIDITQRKNMEEQLRNAHDTLEHKVLERTEDLRHANVRLEGEIADRKRAEHEVGKQRDFLNTILNSIDHGIVVFDAEDYTIKLANHSARGTAFTLPMRCHELMHGRETPCKDEVSVCPLEETKRTGRPSVTMHNHVGPDGKQQYVEIHASPVFDENGKVVQVINNVIDITKRKQAEQALVDAKELAEATNRLMSEFIDTVSHELRTPMTSVHGFSRLIDKSFREHFSELAEKDDKLQHKAERITNNLKIIIAESQRLTSLISDHLDLSKLQSGRIDWQKSDIVPADLLHRAEEATASLFADTPLTMEASADTDLPTFEGDPDRLLQVLINLISNAVKFTGEGGIYCTATLKGDEIIFSVRDTGVGIPEDLQEEIFSKFKQVHSNEKGKPAGTGLGLAISREIILHHNGRIWVKSTPGKGSTFFFALPV